MASGKRLLLISQLLLTVLVGLSSAQNFGRTFDVCREDSDCDASLTCNVIERSAVSVSINPCNEDESVCLCSPKSVEDLAFCTSSSTCPQLERCASITSVNMCVSCSVLIEEAEQNGITIDFLDDAESNCMSPTNTPSVLSSPSLPATSLPPIITTTPIVQSDDPLPMSPTPVASLSMPSPSQALESPIVTPSSITSFTQTPTPAIITPGFSFSIDPQPSLTSPPVGPEAPTNEPSLSHTPFVDMTESDMPSVSEPFEMSDAPSDPTDTETSPMASQSALPSDLTPVASMSPETPAGSETDVPVESPSDEPSDEDEPPSTIMLPSASGDVESEGDGVCVDAALLAQVPQKDRVFSTDRRASVLCDASGTCATSGHMVVWKNKPVSMMQYCSMLSTPCTAQVRWVNSPRYSRGLRLPSRTNGLQLTPLAAKWNTKGERFVLSLAVRMGL